MTLKLLTPQQPTWLKQRDCFWYPSEDEHATTSANLSLAGEALDLTQRFSFLFGNPTQNVKRNLGRWKWDVVKLSIPPRKQYFFFWFWTGVWPEDGKSLIYVALDIKISNQCFGFCVILRRAELKNKSSIWNFNVLIKLYSLFWF